MQTFPDFWQQTFPTGRQTLNIRDANDRAVAIAYGEAGTGRPLFLLHGLGSWSYNWRYNVPPLSEQFRVICVDAKGYGFSEAPPLPETVGHQVIELAKIIPALAEPPVAIAAESLGALIALAVAQSYPELIERLILINVPIFPKKLPSWGMQLIAAVPLPLIEWIDQQQLIRPFTPLVQELTRIVRREVVIDPDAIADIEIHWLTYPYLNRPGTLTQFAADLQIALREIERCQQGQPNWISTIQQKLSQVTCPALVLWSDSDQWFPLQDGEMLRNQLPHAELQVIPNCGHVASSGNPEVVNKAILKFLMG